MSFAQEMLNKGRPKSIRANVRLPRRQTYFPSPTDWRDEVLYFLLVDRFSDGQEPARPLLNRNALGSARPDLSPGVTWHWDQWAQSGSSRFQGGTLKGVKSKLGYLKQLGISALWLSPVFTQRVHLDTYHGYGIQDFLDVDPRFGDRNDLVALVEEAHQQGFKVILDIIFNHSGSNWIYSAGTPGGVHQAHYNPFGRYAFGAWRDQAGQSIININAPKEGVWPIELQDTNRYTRAGTGNLDQGDINDPHAEHKRCDFCDLRDFYLEEDELIRDLALCYQYWIALTDCDGFRLDTLKHVTKEQARNFCGSIKEYAVNLGKDNFFLLGEIAGGDSVQDSYLDAMSRNLNAALDIGNMRLILHGVSKGLKHPWEYFNQFNAHSEGMESHRIWGSRHVSVLDDHDHVCGSKIRFSHGASNDHQIAAAVAIQLFSLGIPCIYYGSEQAFSGPPKEDEIQYLPDWGGSDRYLREAMFGPDHPRQTGQNGLQAGAAGQDTNMPGFGPFGTAGQHCFDKTHPVFIRIASLISLRKHYPVLRYGRQYIRPISFLQHPFDIYGPGEILAWSRILDVEEALCVVNVNGTETRGADVVVDATLNPPGSTLTVILNSAEVIAGSAFSGTHPVNSKLPVHVTADGKTYVELRDLGPSEVVVLLNHPASEAGAYVP